MNLPEIYHISYHFISSYHAIYYIVSYPIHQSITLQFNFRMKRAKSWFIFQTLNSLPSIIATNMVSVYECFQVPVLFSKRCKLRC